MLKLLKLDKKFITKVLVVAVPFMLQQLITSSVNLLDSVMVGQLGDAAVAGVAAANRFYMIATFGIFGVTGAASIFIAQYFGKKDDEHVKQSYRYSVLATYAIIAPFVILGLIMPRSIIGFFTKDADVIRSGAAYLQFAILTYIPLGLSMAIGNAMRSVGETKLPLYISIVAIATNAIFNYLLIFGTFGFPKWGVMGAAIATLIARLVEMGIYMLVVRKKHFVFNTRYRDMLHISKKLVESITIKALPLVTNEILWYGGIVTLFKFYSVKGTEVMAGLSIASTISDVFFVLMGGMAVATTVIVSQPLGANHLDEARSNGYNLLKVSFLLALFFGVLMFISSFIFPQFYAISESSRVFATNIIRIQSVMFVIYMSNAQCYFILRAGGDTKSTLYMDAVFMWVVNIPVVGAATYLTAWSVYGIYMLGQSTDLLKLVFAYGLVRKEKWVKNLTHAHEQLV